MTFAPTEAKDGTREWVLLQHLLRLHRQAIEAAPHIGHTARQIDPHAGRHRDQALPPSSTATRRANATGSMLSSTLSMRPLPSTTSTTLVRRREETGRISGTGGDDGGRQSAGVGLAGGAIRTGTNELSGCGMIEMPGRRSSRANRSHV